MALSKMGNGRGFLTIDPKRVLRLDMFVIRRDYSVCQKTLGAVIIASNTTYSLTDVYIATVVLSDT